MMLLRSADFQQVDRAGCKQAFVRLVYARHNRSVAVRTALQQVFRELERAGGLGVDIGAGGSRLHSRLISLDCDPAGRPQTKASAEALPFRDGSLGAVVSQEVFEHLADPAGALNEAVRVLAPGGVLYLQTPFVIGYHDGPRDYWRFTRDGIERFLANGGLQVERVEESVGAGTAAYRIAVEFAAVMAGSIWRRAYLPAKGLAAVLCAPLRLADRFTMTGPHRHRLPGGYLALARKPL